MACGDSAGVVGQRTGNGPAVLATGAGRAVTCCPPSAICPLVGPVVHSARDQHGGSARATPTWQGRRPWARRGDRCGARSQRSRSATPVGADAVASSESFRKAEPIGRDCRDGAPRAGSRRILVGRSRFSIVTGSPDCGVGCRGPEHPRGCCRFHTSAISVIWVVSAGTPSILDPRE